MLVDSMCFSWMTMKPRNRAGWRPISVFCPRRPREKLRPSAEPGWLAAYQRFLSAPPSGKIAAVGGTVLNEFEIPLPKWADASATFDHGNAPKCLPHRGSLYGGNAAYRCEVA